jgi:hypothetical protein
MSKINQIENKILELDGGTFQKLADAYLHKKGYEQINPLGSVIGANKTRKGTPDTFIPLPNGKYVFAEYTTHQKNVLKKLKGDLVKCLNEAKTGIPVSKIDEIVICHTSILSLKEREYLTQECQGNGINVNIFGIDTISFDLYQKYPGLARDFLGIEVDTGQIVSPSEFVTVYDKSKFSTRLDTVFHFRENEVKQALMNLDEGDCLVISGRPGVGKSRFALECCKRFVADHKNYEIRCIFNRGADLFEDIRVHFSEPGSFIIFVDDANRISRFDYIIQLACEKREDQHIKLVATVRDYALDKVREASKRCDVYTEIELPIMKDDEIKQFVESEFGIRNHDYLERIIDIAKGNPRLAVMAAQTAKRENTLQSIDNVAALYAEFFSSVQKDLSDINQPNLLKVAGIMVFFRSVDRSNKEMMESIEKAFKIPNDIFWEAAQRLHELELFDIYEDEVVRVSDQVLATYLFDLAFFKEKVADFGTLLQHFFPAFLSRFAEALHPILNAFDSRIIIDSLRPHIDHYWTEMEKTGDEEGLLSLIRTFWYVKRTDTLIYMKKKVEELPIELIDPAALDFKPIHDSRSPSFLEILSFFRHVGGDEFRIALELILDYLSKQPKKLPNVLYLFIESLSFNHRDHLRRFSIQRAIVDVLWRRSIDGHNLFSRLFLEVANKYLHTHFLTHESKGNKSITLIRFDIPNTPDLLALRKDIWLNIFQLYQYKELQGQVLNVLHNYTSSRLEVSSTEIITYDSSMIIPFIESNLNPSALRHCIIVQEYLNLLCDHKVVFDVAIQERFKSEIWVVAKLLTLDIHEMLRLNMDHRKFEEYRAEKIKEHFSHYAYTDYERFFDQCLEIQMVINQGHENYLFQNGIICVFLTLYDTDPYLFHNVVELYLIRGDQFRIHAGSVVKRLIETAGIDESFDILNRHEYQTKRSWLFWWFTLLTPEAVTTDRLEYLYALYREATQVDLVYDLDFLMKYRRHDQKIIPKITKIILGKAETDSAIARALSCLFNPYSEINKVLEDEFAGDLLILKQAYFATNSVDTNMDYDGQTLSRIMDLDEDFIIEYVDYLYNAKKNISGYNSECDYSFIWKRDDFKQIITRISEHIYGYEKKERLHSIPDLAIFFELKGNDKSNFDLMEKQDSVLRHLIENRYGDTDFMKMVFSVVVQFPAKRRFPFVSSFLLHNDDFSAFEEIPLEPYYHGWNDSAVPMYQERLEYFESLLPLTNTVKLLQHKQYIEQEIQSIRSQIEREKKRDFMRE